MRRAPSLIIVATDAVLAAVLKSEAKLYSVSINIQDALPRSAGRFDILVVPAALFLESSDPFYEQTVFAYGSPSMLELCYAKGCSDFLKNPWTLSELLCKTRRFTGYPQTFPGLPLFLTRNGLMCGTQTVKLTSREEVILSCLARNYQQVVTREHLWLYLNSAFCIAPVTAESRAIDIHITRLRKKLVTLKKETVYLSIKAVYNRGYTLVICDCG